MHPKTKYERYEVWSPDTGRYRSGERQAKPYNLLCAMSNADMWADRNETVYRDGRVGRAVDVRATEEPFANLAGDSDLYKKATNQSYKRLVDQLGDSASLGATLTAERRETWGMVVWLVVRAVSAARNVRKLRLAEAARDLGVPYRERVVKERHRVRQPNRKIKTIIVRKTCFTLPNGRVVAKTSASGWLLYSYGIAPLMGDIQASMDILHSPFPWHKIQGGGRAKSGSTRGGQQQGYYHSHRYELECRVKQSVLVRVSNPNLYLAGRLGLVNPVQWANEAIPLSFVVDWFSNLSDVIASMSDFVGLETSHACINTSEHRIQTIVGSFPDRYTNARWHQTFRTRGLNLVTPRLVFAYERFQWQRGLNAISLLIGFLPRK